MNKPTKFYKQLRSRRGQTLTEYALLIAYLAIVGLHSLQGVSNESQEQFIYTNGSLIISQTTLDSQSGSINGGGTMTPLQAQQILAVYYYIYNPDTWKGVTSDYVASAQARVMDRLASAILGYNVHVS